MTRVWLKTLNQVLLGGNPNFSRYIQQYYGAAQKSWRARECIQYRRSYLESCGFTTTYSHPTPSAASYVVLYV